VRVVVGGRERKGKEGECEGGERGIPEREKVEEG
jgi:hypothetical protein